MIAIIGDAHEMLDELHAVLDALPRRVRAVIQLGDLWVWPDPADVPPGADGHPRELPPRPRDPRLHWRRPPRDLYYLDGNHHNFPVTRGLTTPTRIAPGLTFLPRGTVLTLPGERGPLRVGVLGGAESVLDAPFRRPGVDWWPEEERVSDADVERLVGNARAAGGVDLLLVHTPPAWVTTEMTQRPPHPSARLVEQAWEALGRPETVCGHMHQTWRDYTTKIEVLPMLGVTTR